MVVRSGRVFFVAGVVVGLLVLWGPLGLVGKAPAALPSNCSSGPTVTCLFSYTGTEQLVDVPSEVSSVDINAVGAPGGLSDCAPPPGGGCLGVGALGGIAYGSVRVTPGAKLYVEVGAAGYNAVGYLGAPGGGGGASEVRAVTCGVSGCPGSSESLGSRLVVAGGGGGAGGGNIFVSGGAGGNAGAAGSSGSGTGAGMGGGTGTSSAGGAGGAGGHAGPLPDLTNGGDGSSGGADVGGLSGGGGNAGGAGGGGYYGGGGGGGGIGGPASYSFAMGGGGGGGGGSSWVEPGAIAASTGLASPGQSASVTIGYTVPQPSASSLVSSANPALATQSVTLTATITGPHAGSAVPTGTVTFKDGQTALATTILDTAGRATYETSSLTVGTHEITAFYRGNAVYQGSSSQPLSEVIVTDTPPALANLTLQYVENSARFVALPASQQQLLVRLANHLIARLAHITQSIRPTQLAKLVTAFKHIVAILQADGWLTADQASMLTGLANHVRA